MELGEEILVPSEIDLIAFDEGGFRTGAFQTWHCDGRISLPICSAAAPVARSLMSYAAAVLTILIAGLAAVFATIHSIPSIAFPKLARLRTPNRPRAHRSDRSSRPARARRTRHCIESLSLSRSASPRIRRAVLVTSASVQSFASCLPFTPPRAHSGRVRRPSPRHCTDAVMFLPRWNFSSPEAITSIVGFSRTREDACCIVVGFTLGYPPGGRKSHGATRIYEAAITGKRRLFRATEQFPCFVEPHAAALGLKPQGCCWHVCILEGRL